MSTGNPECVTGVKARSIHLGRVAGNTVFQSIRVAEINML